MKNCLSFTRTSGLLLVAAVSLLIIGVVRAENNQAVIVNGFSTNITASPYAVGDTGTNNSLQILNGGSVMSTNFTSGQLYGEVYMGNSSSASNNSAVVAGSNSLWTVNGYFYVGRSSSGNSLTISNGGQLVNLSTGAGSALSAIGHSGSSNSVLVTGPGSVWSNAVAVRLGNIAGAANNMLTVSNRARVYDSLLLVGINSANNQVLITDGGQLFSTLGGGNANVLGVNNALYTNNNVRITGNGSLWQIAGQLVIGNDGAAAIGSGNVFVENGGTLEANTINLGTNTSGGVSSSLIANGGGLQFTKVAPTLTLKGGAANPMVVSNGWISFRGINNADVMGSLGGSPLTNILFSGRNTFRLNNASNTLASAAQNYTFGYTSANPSNYAGLEMINGGTAWKSAWLTISNNGTMLVSNSSASVDGTFTNLGSVRVINSRVTWSSNVVISGSYFSDPSTNIFATNVTVSSSGYLQGSNGDQFVFYKDFRNLSTVNTNFSLWQAAVLFTNGAGTSNHTYDVTGSGSANWGTGFTNFDRVSTNFAIGTLSIAPGNRLMITGQVGGGITNAVYVGWLDIQGWSTNNGFSSVTNTLFSALNLPDINVYYSREDPRNQWLNEFIPDTGYALWGSGLLLPIPEPSAFLVLGAGLGLLAFLRRRCA